MSYEEVVFNRSYINIILLNRSIPSFNTDNEEEDGNNGTHSSRRVETHAFRHESELFNSLM